MLAYTEQLHFKCELTKLMASYQERIEMLTVKSCYAVAWQKQCL